MVDVVDYTHAAPERLTFKIWLAVVFGGWCQATWWLVMCLMAYCALAAGTLHFDFLTFETETATTVGTITNVEKHVSTPPHRAHSVRYSYTFRYDIGEQTLRGVAHSRKALERDAEVEVEYVLAAPRNARVVGTTTRQTSGMMLVMTLILFFACVAWTLTRITGLRNRVDRIRYQLQQRPLLTPWGVFPKLRLNRDGEIITWGSTSLLFAPVTSLLFLVMATIIVEV
tara:strand:- start:1642 stop:2322 length:681 start_codon:yes stop_codon:yes gene_type:complete